MAKTAEMAEVSLSTLRPYERNAKTHSAEQVQKIAASIQEFGFLSPCLIDKAGNIIAGHGRVEAAKLLGMDTVPCVYVEGLSDAQRRAYILADNKLTELGEWDDTLVQWELHVLEGEGFDVSLLGFDAIETPRAREADPEAARVTLADRFLVPPFSVLDSRQKWWQDRKRAWKALGIKSEEGRGNDGDGTEDGLTYAKSHVPPTVYEAKNKAEELLGSKITWDEFYSAFPQFATLSNTSIFDPVICEIAYRWFAKAGEKVLDPFAGGSVRGIVAALLGREYTGVDLSERQVEANIENWGAITHAKITDGGEATPPRWIVGDSTNLDELVPDNDFDLLFTCPPYADPEVYSDDPRDISTMDYSEFCRAYSAIIRASVAKLKPNAFAVVVVGDVRDKRGNFRDFVSYTIKAFRDAGMALYNEGILVTQNGSIATIAGSTFDASRKQAKHHQNVLIFADDRGTVRKIDLDDPEQGAEDIAEAAKDKRLARNHKKVLTFSKGNAKARAQELGTVDANAVDSFIVIM